MNLMNNFTVDYRLSLYTELTELSQDKIYIVQSSLDDRIYLKKILSLENYDVYSSLKNINSPNFPKIHEIIKLDDKLVVIEEYISGSNLQEILENRKTLSEDTVRKYGIELCNILNTLHSQNPPIIHRDIKPSNIMIADNRTLKLIDFDVSRTHKTSQTADTKILGTYGYAAPEQFGFSQSDARTDIYSLGVTMNTLLTGYNAKGNLYKGKLSKIITKCTKMDPDKRYKDVMELKAALTGKPKVRNSKLPGFKSGNLIFKILGFLWYGFLVLAAFGSLTEETTIESRITDVLIVLFLFSATLLLGNYRDIKTRLPLLSSSNFLIRIIGHALYLLLLFLIFAFMLPS